MLGINNSPSLWEHPNFAKIKFVVRTSCSLASNGKQDARTTKK
ncbi:MAG: hypothetical protein AAGG00_21390 [Cyanobacteria bacterium P01_H01_bin.150]